MKIFIKNRKAQKISMFVEEGKPGSPLVFVMHGLGGWKDQPHIRTFAEVFLENGFTVVRFDTTNTFGESDGTYEDATTTNYYEDLEDVIAWASKEPWYQEPFWLTGHSLGGMCTAVFAENYPEKVAGLAPTGTVVSGALSRSLYTAEELSDWEHTGWRITQKVPDRIKKLKWSEMIDRLRYDLLPRASKLTMPVLLLVGEKDDSCPVKHQRLLFEVLPGPKELEIVSGAPHTFRTSEHLAEAKRLLAAWIKTYATK